MWTPISRSSASSGTRPRGAEFLQDDLGDEGLARSWWCGHLGRAGLDAAASAYLTLAIAEFFRDEDKDVLCLWIRLPVSRWPSARSACRREPPTAKGYTPTVFTELPKLLERAGPGVGVGTSPASLRCCGCDDHNEPIADAVRGILDGHIVMQRSIAERVVFPRSTFSVGFRTCRISRSGLSADHHPGASVNGKTYAGHGGN